jgi:hypothetical protein
MTGIRVPGKNPNKWRTLSHHQIKCFNNNLAEKYQTDGLKSGGKKASNHYLNIVNLTTSFSKCLHYLIFYFLAMIVSTQGSHFSIGKRSTDGQCLQKKSSLLKFRFIISSLQGRRCLQSWNDHDSYNVPPRRENNKQKEMDNRSSK